MYAPAYNLLKPFLLSFTMEIFGYTMGNGLKLGIEIRDAKDLTSFSLEIGCFAKVTYW